MISKKKLKERLIDICNGAGMEWQPGDGCFEYYDGQLEGFGRIIQACERAFSLGDSKILRAPWRLKDFEGIDTLTDLVHECIKFDTGEKGLLY